MNDGWEPGDPIYDESDLSRTYQREPMFSFRDDANGTAARWTPTYGWTRHDEVPVS